jgi:hypothetical protein
MSVHLFSEHYSFQRGQVFLEENSESYGEKKNFEKDRLQYTSQLGYKTLQTSNSNSGLTLNQAPFQGLLPNG